MPGAVRAVFDTNIFLRALINPHSRCGRLVSRAGHRYVLVLSPDIIKEILEVLRRPAILQAFPGVAAIGADKMLGLFARAEVVQPATVTRTSRDPEDDMFLACAVAGRCHYVVSEDKDLTSLGQHRGVRIVTSEEFAAIIEAAE